MVALTIVPPHLFLPNQQPFQGEIAVRQQLGKAKKFPERILHPPSLGRFATADSTVYLAPSEPEVVTFQKAAVLAKYVKARILRELDDGAGEREQYIRNGMMALGHTRRLGSTWSRNNSLYEVTLISNYYHVPLWKSTSQEVKLYEKNI